MKKWEIQREVFYRTAPPSDFTTESLITIIDNTDRLISIVVDYFISPSDELIYPAKSYAVAIIYAALLEKYFGEQFITALNNPNLLRGDDMFFVTYSNDVATYDAIITQLHNLHLIDVESSTIPQVRVTVSCFKREFMIE